MRHTSFDGMQCAVARSLQRVGEWWTILILRDAFYGMTRFEEFQSSLGIAPSMLTRRLKSLVADGLMERHRYADNPPRDEYRLTRLGRDFQPVIIAMFAWGNRHFAPEGAAVELIDRQTGERAEPMLVDRVSGAPLTGRRFAFVAGPAANDETRAKLGQERKRPSP